MSNVNLETLLDVTRKMNSDVFGIAKDALSALSDSPWKEGDLEYKELVDAVAWSIKERESRFFTEVEELSA